MSAASESAKGAGRTPSTFVISLTPFGDDGSLDEARLRAHLRRLAASGIGVYVAGSGSGEAYTLDADELRRVVEVAVEELSGKVPVRAMGFEPRTADQMIGFARMAVAAGVDAVQVYSLEAGHDHRTSNAELERYYGAVLEAIDAPVVLSTHFSVGYLVPVELLAALAERYEQIIGVNCTTPDLTYLLALVDALDERVDVHVGGPALALSAFALGANGYLSSEGNVAPRLCQSLVTHHVAGDLDALHDAYTRVMRLFSMAMRYDHVCVGRAELELLGLSVGPPRLPRLPITDEAILRELGKTLDELDIRAVEQLA